uniref:unspecific monooxygenase n=1 Tax=Pectinophora gossypiella TaxID=13191 RepID=A0A1E1WIT9_PECGO
MLLFLIWGAVLLGALMLYFRQVYSHFKKRGVKTEPVVPFFGNMLRIIMRKEHMAVSLNTCYNSFSEERFVGRFEFTKPLVIVRDLELIKKITIKDFEHFLDHRVFIDEHKDPLFGRNLFSLKGQEWKDMRSTLSPAFTSSKMKLMLPFMMEVGDHMVLNLKKNIKESNTAYLDLDAKDLTTRFANDVIATCAFGLKVNSHSERDNQFYAQGLIASTFKFKQLVLVFLSSAFPNFMKYFNLKLFSEKTSNFFISLVMDTMKDRDARNILRPDMIQLLIEAKKGKVSHEENAVDPDAGFATVDESDVGKKDVNKSKTTILKMMYIKFS